ncbi:DNA polymerase III subunit delta' [Alteromonas sp. ASW11-36]|uniref:DNA-directed DNA polymerase n=1 Tax=Alteromonas arenosi TaxID=3055817 RepID=A0ABT7SX27_9ALTE|nr:DNA polymerase III subunit delta' [Alteromonas sp. ASW11-36]MDM7860735.1 DNA polymerase III subunit delta' [Alteromonas sp. ASW11-36]
MTLPWFDSNLTTLAQRAIARRLHHALLFSGPRDIGKQHFARDLAQMLLCKDVTTHNRACGQCQACNLFIAGSHPDFIWLTTEKTQISVDAIREAIQQLNTTAQLTHNKVLVIPDAHLLSESAANALLKTLEEPTPSTFIILLTPFVSRLLPTILSRCEKHTLHTPDATQSLPWITQQLHAQGHNVDVEPSTLAAYGNAPFAVINSVVNADALSFDEFSQTLQAVLARRLSPLDAAEKYQKDYLQVINWVQRDVNSKTKDGHQQLLERQWQAANRLDELALSARHAGVNKVLLLTEIFDTVLESVE